MQSLSSWSPGTMHTTGVPSSAMRASDLRVPLSGKPKNLETASMVPRPGVLTFWSVPSPGPSVTATFVAAASSSAANPQASQ